MFKNIRYDLRAIKERDPAARNRAEIFFLYSGFHAVLYHRFAHFLYKHHLKFLGRFVSQTGRFFTGIEIHPAATIGRGLLIDHGSGVVIGETAEVGDNCTIYQGVTLGGTGKHVGKRHPTIGNNVMIGSGAKVLGPFKVGDDAKIAAGAVVLNEVPAGATAVGVPARMILPEHKREKEAVEKSDLDQIHIPDPVYMELCHMRVQIENMQKKLDALEKRPDASDSEQERTKPHETL